MNCRPGILILLVIALLAVTSTGWAKTNRYTTLTTEILESLQSFYPVQATAQGIHSYDHRLADYSGKSVGAMTQKLTGFTQRLYKYRGLDRTPAAEADYRLIRSNVEIALLDLKRIKWHTKSPQLYVDEAVDGLYSLLLAQHKPMAEKLYVIIDRMKAVPALFAVARKNITKPPKEWVELAQESLESGQEFYRQAGGQLMREYPERADELLKVSTAAREAMNDFSIWLATVPIGSPTSFSVGKNNFDYLLQHGHLLEFDSDSLLVIGEQLLAEADSMYQEYRQFMEGERQNGKDSLFVPAAFSRQDILDYYQWETEQTKIFLESNNIVTVPDDIAPVRVAETPEFLRSMIAAIAYHPAGPFDENQEGIFYVRPVPEDLDRRQLEARFRYTQRRGFKGSVTHEAFPGHHLQMQIAGQHSSDIRRWQHNLMLVEGWALYCEEMMYRSGFYGEEDPAMWLAILGGIRYRAARIIADVKLHTGQFTFEECANWMIDVLEAETTSDQAYHRKMVRKYTLTPSRWLTYLMGKREVTRLRDAAMARDGDAFDLCAFHDTLLAQGSIPPSLLWDLLGLKN